MQGGGEFNYGGKGVGGGAAVLTTVRHVVRAFLLLPG